jgi:hypothetical protein
MVLASPADPAAQAVHMAAAVVQVLASVAQPAFVLVVYRQEPAASAVLAVSELLAACMPEQ